MFLFIIGICILIGGLVLSFFLPKDKSKIIRAIVIGISLVAILFSCMASVPTGHTGVITTFGKVEDKTLDAGIHFLAPWNSVVKMDNRVQKASFNLAAFSKDIQEVQVTYTLNYQINKSNAQDLYRTVGKEYLETVVNPTIAECVKVAVSKYNAEGLVSDRNILASDIEKLLMDALAQYNIEVVSTAVEDLDFTDAFTDAVEAKQVAQQNKLKAATEQEQKTIEEKAAAERAIIAANAEAEKAKINAQADLEVTKIQADAAEYAGLKEAARIEAVANAITKNYLTYKYLEEWDGTLPSTMLGNNTDISYLFDNQK